MVILAAVGQNFWIGLLACTTLITAASYSLWLYKRIYFGKVANAQVAALKDLDAREYTVLGLLALAVLAMGVYPKPLSDVMEVSVDRLVQHVSQSKL
jgi:NADH-quinone oxidoreductase subunit M